MSVSYIKIFNQVVDEFFNELIDIFPEEPKIKVQYTLFQTIIKANAKKPAVEFMIKSLPYLEKIALRDEQFFISHDTPQFLQALNVEKIWKTVSDNTKNAIWKYIQSFFTIGVKIVETPPETREIINYIINKV
jgi:hypothetical protein